MMKADGRRRSHVLRRFVGALGLYALAVSSVAMVPAEKKPAIVPPSVTVYGGAEEVSGSLSILKVGDEQYMIDCGAYYPFGPGTSEEREARAEEENRKLPVKASKISAVFLTHSHLDHIGRLPLLISKKYRKTIYVTPGTAAIAPVMLEMQVKSNEHLERDWYMTNKSVKSFVQAHWQKYCSWGKKIRAQNKLTFHGDTPGLIKFLESQGQGGKQISPCKTCVESEVRGITKRFKVLQYLEPTEVSPGVTVTLMNAGHIPGSASFLFEVEESAARPGKKATSTARPGKKKKKGKTWRIAFSGDVGHNASPLHIPPEPCPKSNMVFVETTYGGFHRAEEKTDERVEFRKAVADIVKDGGVVLVPAFALDRVQKILYEITLAKREGLIDKDVPVGCPSPSATELTGLYRQKQKTWFREEIAKDPDAFRPDGLVEGMEATKVFGGKIPRPSIVVTTSGMLESAFSGELLPKIVEDEKCAVFLVGYQDPGSQGGQLKAGSRTLKLGNTNYQVNAKIRSFGCFSAHFDATGSDEWLSKQAWDTKVVFVHGEKKGLERRVAQTKEKGFTDVMWAKPAEVIRLEGLR